MPQPPHAMIWRAMPRISYEAPCPCGKPATWTARATGRRTDLGLIFDGPPEFDIEHDGPCAERTAA